MLQQINLSGQWSFALDAEKNGIEKKFYCTKLDDTISLPGTTSIAKKGTPSSVKEIGFLTDPYAFSGYAWYQKEVTLDASLDELKDKQLVLHLERTRLTKVWINDLYVGECDSLTTPHDYDITDKVLTTTFTITILVSNVDYPTKGGHLTSPDTQTNWNGIIGDISLKINDLKSIYDVKVSSDIDKKELIFDVRTVNWCMQPAQYKVAVAVAPISIDSATESGISCIAYGDYSEIAVLDIDFPKGSHVSSFTVPCPDMALWSEYSPIPYDIKFEIIETGDTYHCISGMRQFSTTETEFLINGEPTFLRGKHDGLIFPLTGAVPATVSEWLKVMAISKSYGINHYRFHTCCPPEAAFTAADLLGIYMEPQLPFWGTLTAPTDENHNPDEQDYLITEGFRMMKAYGNHPSFCMMSLGNELWGSPERMAEIIRNYRAVDARHLYTQGSNNFQHTPLILPEDDFFVGVRFAKNRLIRGSYGMCDAPLGHLQWSEPSTNHNYDEDIFPSDANSSVGNEVEEIEIQYGTGVKKVKAAKGDGPLVPHIPVVTHEIGQYAVYPNFKEIDKYTGVLKARNFEVFRDRLNDKGMLDLADDFFKASGKLSAACYKEELEAAARSRLVAGYQILDIQDFSGQGTALVGMLDAFMESKGLITEDEWSEFCSDGILLGQFEKYIYTANEEMKLDLAIRYYNPESLNGKVLHYEVINKASVDAKLCGDVQLPDNVKGLVQLGSTIVEMPHVDVATAFTINLTVPGTKMKNHYEIYVYPQQGCAELENFGATIDCTNDSSNCATNDCILINRNEKNPAYITASYTKAAELLHAGNRVLFFPTDENDSLEGFYCTDFWCYPMFRDICEWMKKPVAVGTMGLLIDDTHPAITHMLSKRYSTPQWYQIVTSARCAILDDNTATTYRPIVQMIDNFERNHKLGILFEGKVSNGTLLVCTSKLWEIRDRIEVKQFANSLCEYITSDAFNPDGDLNDYFKSKKC